MGRSGDDTEVARDRAVGFSDFYNTKTADAGAGINTEDFHGTIILYFNGDYGALTQRTDIP